jgi:pyruvate-formate lyase-activating enzyme
MQRVFLLPSDIVRLAKAWGCDDVQFTFTEPMLTWEFVREVASLARRAGLTVTLHTNGFSSSEAVWELAPYVNFVLLGIKGSLDEKFYERHMQSPGAAPAVLESAKAWALAGVSLVVGDLIAPPHMQADDAAEQAQRRLYEWVRRELGDLQPLVVWPMVAQGKKEAIAKRLGAMIPSRDMYDDYVSRVGSALEIARGAGLKYAFARSSTMLVTADQRWLHEDDEVPCHHCGALLFRAPRVHPVEVHNPVFEITAMKNGRCGQCGVEVPVVASANAETGVPIVT